MDKQRTVNTVTANDEWSQNLMKMYENWMGGDTFQNSTIKEDEIPTGQKQGGGDGAPFVTAIGSLPAIETDKSTTIPVIPELGVTDKTEKNTAQTDSANPGEPPVALKGTMTIGQGSLSSGQRQSQGKQISYTNVVTREEKESIEEKKAKKDHDGDGKIESGKAEYFGSKDKAIKKAMKKEEAECCPKCGSTVHEESACDSSKEKKAKYKKEVKTEEWKAKAKKKVDKIMSYKKKKY